MGVCDAARIVAHGPEAGPHALRDGPETGPELRLRLEHVQDGQDRGDRGRRRRGAEDQRPGVVLDVGDDRLRAGHDAADRGEGLAEGAHDQVDLAFEAEVLGRAAAVRAEDADAVGVVDEDPGPVLPGQRDDARQVGDVALHAEDAVDDDELAGPGIERGEQPLEVLHVVVAVLVDGRERQAAGVDDAGVDHAVDEDVVALPGDRGDDAEVGLVARAEGQGGLAVQELGQPLLELLVEVDRAGQEARAAGPDPVAVDRRLGRRLGQGMIGQAEVVVRADHDHRPAPDLDAVPDRLLDGGEVGVQVGRLELVGPGEGQALVEKVHARLL